MYDFRTNQHFTLKTQPLTRERLNDFVARYRPGERHKREESDAFRRWIYKELDERPEFNLDVWAYVEDKSLEEAAQIPPPEVLAEEIITTVSAARSPVRVRASVGSATPDLVLPSATPTPANAGSGRARDSGGRREKSTSSPDAPAAVSLSGAWDSPAVCTDHITDRIWASTVILRRRRPGFGLVLRWSVPGSNR